MWSHAACFAAGFICAIGVVLIALAVSWPTELYDAKDDP